MPSDEVGKLSAVRFVRLHPLSLFGCYVYPQPDTMGGYWRRIHASMGLYVSVRGDVAAAVDERRSSVEAA